MKIFRVVHQRQLETVEFLRTVDIQPLKAGERALRNIDQTDEASCQPTKLSG